MPYALGTILKIDLHFKCGPFRAAMTRHFRVSSTPTGQPPPGAFVVGFYAKIQEALEPCLTLDSEPIGGRVYQWGGADWTHLADQELLGLQGSGPSGPLPPMVAGLVRFRPVDPQSTSQGRIYVPFPSEAYNGTNGKPTTTYLTNLQSLADMYTTDTGISATGQVTPFAPKLLDIRPVLRPWSAANMVATAVAYDGWATQRRRGDPTRFQSPFG